LLSSQVFDEALFIGLVIGTHHVPDALTADQVTDLLGKVLGVISSPLQCLGHEENMEAFLPRSIIVVLQVP
jgi:hypothetical protein